MAGMLVTEEVAQRERETNWERGDYETQVQHIRAEQTIIATGNTQEQEAGSEMRGKVKETQNKTGNTLM